MISTSEEVHMRSKERRGTHRGPGGHTAFQKGTRVVAVSASKPGLSAYPLLCHVLRQPPSLGRLWVVLKAPEATELGCRKVCLGFCAGRCCSRKLTFT